MIRPATDDDISSIIYIWKGNIETNNTPADIAYAFRRFRKYWFVSESDRRISGFVAGTVKSTTRGHISGIAVLEEYQRCGMGNGLLSMLENAFISDGFKKITLEVRLSNMDARRLYEMRGFEQTHVVKGYYPDGEAAMNYEKILRDYKGNLIVDNLGVKGFKNAIFEDMVRYIQDK
ncbi:MAG: GNAT family N-acetyltransferase [Halobacteriota archaeon]|nr:GNAT family N-acetyltransferase [Halobacteriota archaeon]